MKQSLSLQPPLGAARRGPSWLRTPLSLGAIGVTALLAMGLSSPVAYAQSYAKQTLHTFTGSSGDGANPAASLLNINGVLYGTTTGGGTSGNGTIFSTNISTKAQKTLYSFTGLSDGSYPQGDLINVSGTLYGTAADFYSYNSQFGTVFSINPTSGTETTLYHFTGDSVDGANPFAGLTNVSGLLFGTTYNGGTDGNGTVFSIDPTTKAQKTVHSFTDDPSEAARPLSSLIEVNGMLFGTTTFGGDSGYGAIFSIDPATGDETILHSLDPFDGEGYLPGASLTAVSINGVETLFGTTEYGAQFGDGTIFSINTDGTGFQTLYEFSGSDGISPQGGLHDVYGVLYGTTYLGGIENAGLAFSYNISTQKEKTLYQFIGDVNDGSNPFANLIDTANTAGQDVLYGTTSTGGIDDAGTLFSLTPTVVKPVTYPDNFTVDFDTALNLPILNNDDGGGGILTPTVIKTTTHGTLTLKSDGSYTYTPKTAYLGPDTFTYQAANAAGKSNVATVTITVVATVPVSVNDSYPTKYRTLLTVKAPGVLKNDNPGDNTTPLVSLVTGPAHGTLALNSDGSFTYTPNAGFSGTDTFTYDASNDIGFGNIATVSITVSATTPTAVNNAITVKHNTPRTIGAPGVLGNDDDGGKMPLTAALVSTTTHGTLAFKSDGSFVYTPKTGFGQTDTFTYQAMNPLGKSNIATVTLIVAPAIPVAVNDTYQVKHNSVLSVSPGVGVLVNDNAGGSSSLTASLVKPATHGTLAFKSDGSFVYTPKTGFIGTDTFTYQAVNSAGKSNIATVTLKVSQ